MILGIDERDMLDKSKIKVIDGIAGAAKSSALHAFLTSSGIRYSRLTSTHRLAKDAKDRYNMDVQTICSGLFESPDGRFYEVQKAPPAETVVIDEILQSDPRVIQWSIDHVGDCNIIITTDSCQMLAPEAEKAMSRRFEDLKNRPDVIVSTLTKSYRPRTAKTEQAYNDAYNAVYSDASLFDQSTKRYAKLPPSYDPNNVYICHTKELEKYLYDTYSLRARYDMDLVGKGDLAGKNVKDIKAYPVLPQCEISGRARCWQAANIATPTRYQGSEVEQGRKCYYLIEQMSHISNREWYTVISRLWDIDDLRIVVVDLPRVLDIESFCGYPILEWYTPVVQDLDNLKTKPGKKGVLYADRLQIDRIARSVKEPPGHANRTDCLLSGGKLIVGEPAARTGNAKTMSSLLKKEGTFTYDHAPDMIRALEKHGCCYPVICGVTPSPSTNRKEHYGYGLDLKAAYPHILNNELLPTGEKYAESPFTGGLDWFLIFPDQMSPTNAGLVPAPVLEMIPECRHEYMFTTSCQHGSKMGSWLHEMAHKSVEDKMKIKSIHYGYAEKRYLTAHRNQRTNELDGYVVTRENKHELLMAAVRSYMAGIVHMIRKRIYGDYTHGRPQADCLWFDTIEDINAIGDDIAAMLPNYDFRIFRTADGKEKEEILYQTYEAEPTRKQRKNLRKYRDTARGR